MLITTTTIPMLQNSGVLKTNYVMILYRHGSHLYIVPISTSTFSFSKHVFYPVWEKKFKFLVCRCFHFGTFFIHFFFESLNVLGSFAFTNKDNYTTIAVTVYSDMYAHTCWLI